MHNIKQYAQMNDKKMKVVIILYIYMHKLGLQYYNGTLN